MDLAATSQLALLALSSSFVERPGIGAAAGRRSSFQLSSRQQGATLGTEELPAQGVGILTLVLSPLPLADASLKSIPKLR